MALSNRIPLRRPSLLDSEATLPSTVYLSWPVMSPRIQREHFENHVHVHVQKGGHLHTASSRAQLILTTQKSVKVPRIEPLRHRTARQTSLCKVGIVFVPGVPRERPARRRPPPPTTALGLPEFAPT